MTSFTNIMSPPIVITGHSREKEFVFDLAINLNRVSNKKIPVNNFKWYHKKIKAHNRVIGGRNQPR